MSLVLLEQCDSMFLGSVKETLGWGRVVNKGTSKEALYLTYTFSPVAMPHRAGHDGPVLGRIPGPRSTCQGST